MYLTRPDQYTHVHTELVVVLVRKCTAARKAYKQRFRN